MILKDSHFYIMFRHSAPLNMRMILLQFDLIKALGRFIWFIHIYTHNHHIIQLTQVQFIIALVPLRYSSTI